MIELSNADARHVDIVDPIVRDLVDNAAIAADDLLLVGASCRDILNSALGHSFQTRATSDLDFGIALGDWDAIERVDQLYKRSGSNGIRYLIDGLPVDLMPFGGIEDPSGIARPKARGDRDLIVFGFSDVYEHALTLELPSGHVPRIPSPAGYAAIKMRACVDRLAWGEAKDVGDLALVCFWYANSTAIASRLWDTDEGLAELDATAYDTDLGAVRLLGRDIGRILTPDNAADLQRRWTALDLEALVGTFATPPGAAQNELAGYRLSALTVLGETLVDSEAS